MAFSFHTYWSTSWLHHHCRTSCREQNKIVTQFGGIYVAKLTISGGAECSGLLAMIYIYYNFKFLYFTIQSLAHVLLFMSYL